MIRTFTSPRQKTGERGEDAAATFLVKRGFTIIGRNIANRYGEIDIVARKSGLHHFYEVKAAGAGSWFNPAENMTPAKVRKFLVSVEHYCLARGIRDYRAALLAVRLSGRPDGEASVEELPLA